jgi:thimet oligopeptidase
MRWNNLSFLVLAFAMSACNHMKPQSAAESSNNLEAFQKRAAKFNSVVSLPTFETTTNEIRATVTNTISAGNAALDRVGKLNANEVNFTNTVRALDDLGFQLAVAANRLSVIEQTSTNAEMRDVATESLKEIESWMVGLDYREDVYKALKAYADTHPKLEGEDAKLLSETMRDYRRAGLALPKAEVWPCQKRSAMKSSACARNFPRCPPTSRTTSPKQRRL